MKEIVSLHVGGAGIEIGNAVWQQACEDNGIDQDGRPKETLESPYFLEVKEGRYEPRALLVDSDPYQAQKIQNGPMKNLYNQNHLISDKTDGGGLYSIGLQQAKEMKETLSNKIRLLVENCDSMQGF